MIVKKFNPKTNKWELVSITTVSSYEVLTIQYF